jgi:hypothetical protein
MSGINIAKTYVDVSDLVKSHNNSLFEVNKDGSIRTQNIGEKLANLGSRLFGKYEARKIEKDAKVKEAIVQLFNKSGVSADSYAAPTRDRVLQDRFFNPVALPSRKSALKDHKPTTAKVFVQANQEKFNPDTKVRAQKVLYQSLAHDLGRIADLPQFRDESSQIHNLIRTINFNTPKLTTENAAQNFAQLKEDLRPLGLAFGSGELTNFDLSRGVEEWVKNTSPDQLDRV